MTGIIDVGGGQRDVYGSGVLDRCLDEKIEFDYLLGISAGTANLFTYAAGQRGRTRRFYLDYAFRKEYMSVGNIIKHGHFLNLDYVYDVLSNENGEDPFDFDTFFRYDGKGVIACTGAETGRQIYFDKSVITRNNLTAFKASCALPLICGGYTVNGRFCFDGGVTNPIPVEKAFEDGCDKVVVILTTPVSEPKTSSKYKHVGSVIRRKYPKIAECLETRCEDYNGAVQKLLAYEREGRALVIAPDSLCGMKTLTRDREKLEALYNKGYNDAVKIIDFIKD
jgi:predicted patatin/cPLA2 family phospholipase